MENNFHLLNSYLWVGKLDEDLKLDLTVDEFAKQYLSQKEY